MLRSNRSDYSQLRHARPITSHVCKYLNTYRYESEQREETFYYLTIQSDRVGELRFEMNGETYAPESGKINYFADAHHGSMVAPIILRKGYDRPYKIIENEHVVIIKNNEKYDVTDKKL